MSMQFKKASRWSKSSQFDILKATATMKSTLKS